MQKNKPIRPEIFQMKFIEKYSYSDKKRKRIRRISIGMYPVLLLILYCWPKEISDKWMIPFTIIYIAAVLLINIKAESHMDDTMQVAAGENNTTFHFLCENGLFLEYAFSNDATTAVKKATFNPFHVEIVIQGKGRHGLVKAGEATKADDISFKEMEDEGAFKYALDTTLRFFITNNEFNKAEYKVPFFMGLSKQL